MMMGGSQGTDPPPPTACIDGVDGSHRVSGKAQLQPINYSQKGLAVVKCKIDPLIVENTRMS